MENLKKPQARILAYFIRGGTLTVWKAMSKFGTTELRKIVTRLRRKGCIIGVTATTQTEGGLSATKSIIWSLTLKFHKYENRDIQAPEISGHGLHSAEAIPRGDRTAGARKCGHSPEFHRG